MNNDRRKRIANIARSLGGALDTLEAAIAEFKDAWDPQVEDLSATKDEEQEAFDNLSEGLQAAERGHAMEEAVSALENALSDLEGVSFEDEISAAREAVASLEEIG